jgi:hypothetical protein
MKLYLKDIKNFCFKSSNNRYIRPIVTYDDGITITTELHSKCWSKWSLDNHKIDVNDACVYFLLDQDEVVYIGQTLRENRPFNHEKDKKFTDVYFMPVKSPYHFKIEKSLLSKYRTKYNKQYYAQKINYVQISNSMNVNYVSSIYNNLPNKELTNQEIVQAFSFVWKKDNVQKQLKHGNLFRKVKHGVYIKQKERL